MPFGAQPGERFLLGHRVLLFGALFGDQRALRHHRQVRIEHQ
nr:hypothetical protein [Nocardiopsis composta]